MTNPAAGKAASRDHPAMDGRVAPVTNPTVASVLPAPAGPGSVPHGLRAAQRVALAALLGQAAAQLGRAAATGDPSVSATTGGFVGATLDAVSQGLLGEGAGPLATLDPLALVGEADRLTAFVAGQVGLARATAREVCSR